MKYSQVIRILLVIIVSNLPYSKLNAQFCFDPCQYYGAATAPSGIYSNDFNSDGNLDLAIAENNSTTILIYNGDGSGGFQNPPLAIQLTGTPTEIIGGDFNEDGIIDLATSGGNNNVWILLANGTGGFNAPLDFNANTYPTSLCSGDFNNDTHLDLAVPNGNSSNSISILMGTGTGQFNSAVSYQVGICPCGFSCVKTGDINQDGNLDLVVANQSSNDVSILYGNGLGIFASPINYSVGSFPWAVVISDFNNDGILDIATSNQNSNDVSVLIGTGGGQFASAINYPVGNTPEQLIIGDFDSDGNIDIVTTDHNSNTISILPGTGAGTFNSAVSFSVSSGPFALCTGDFNNDGRLDIGVTNYSTTNFGILLACQNTPNTSIPIFNCPGAFMSPQLANGLVGWWPFCGDADDESGNGNNGTVNGATLTSDRFGNVNSAYEFDGVDDYISVDSSNSLAIQNDISISFWLKANNSSLGYIIDRDICSIADDWQLVWVNNKVGLYSSSSSIFSDTISINSWNNILISRSGSLFKIYLNAILSDSVLIGPAPFSNTSLPIYFADQVCQSSSATNFNGTLDDIGIWNRALDSSEVAQLYNTGLCTQTIAGSCDTLIFNANITGFNPVTYANQVKVYPNPAADNLVIDCGTNYAGLNGYSIRITNLLGQTVYNSPVTAQITNIQLTPPTWVNGTYVVQFINPNGTVMETKRIIIQ